MLPLSHLYTRTPIIFGHRGASAYAPEDTLAAFRRALELGADGIELDVTLSADGAPVVIHDDTVDRTTDGSGRVADLTLEQLRRLDAGRWFGAEFAGERLPTLAEVFAEFGARPIYNVELKRDASAGKLAEKVVALIREYGLAQRVIISSFFLDNLRRVRAVDAALPVGLLYAPDDPLRMLRAVFAPGLTPQAHHPYYLLVNRLTLRWNHQRGYRANVWTINRERDLRRMASLGVDGIITNYPDVAARMRSG